MNKLLLCKDCRWTGKEEDCKSVGKYDSLWEYTKYLLYCPKCNSENLIELAGEGAKLEPVFAPA